MLIERFHSTIVAWSAGLLLAACAESATAPHQLSAASGRWEHAAYQSYAFTAERSCFCRDEGRGPVRVTVQGGQVTAVTMIATGAPVDVATWFTIDGLFALIREQIESLPSRLTVEYHATIGYPTKIAYGTPESDGGGVIFVRDLVRTGG